MNKHINRKKLDKPKITRSYMGVTITQSNYREILDKEGRDGINFHTKHLRAYLKGSRTFTHGIQVDEEGRKLGPKTHRVEAKLFQEK